MTNLQAFWKYLGYANQVMVFVFTPMIIYLMCKVRQLENVHSRSQSAVNVAAPSMIPMQTMPSTAASTPPISQQELGPMIHIIWCLIRQIVSLCYHGMPENLFRILIY